MIRSPFRNLLCADPVSITSPMNSCPRMSPLFIVGIRPSIRCRSEPQIAQLVTLMMTSRPSSILGSGTLSQRMSFVPCQQSAFIIIYLCEFQVEEKRVAVVSGELPREQSFGRSTQLGYEKTNEGRDSYRGPRISTNAQTDIRF
jgi:hypothetical protein